MERGHGWKPNVEICPPCPRCGSSNTKFCYYNNYSLTQPRYFCKGCRRYWTKGGSLRNIPVGGGCRKTRRAKSIRVSDTINSQNYLAHSHGGATDYIGRGNVENHVSGGGSGGSPMMQPTNIDIQQVYANFLNQRPQFTHQEHVDHDPVLMHGDHENPMTALVFPSNIPNIEIEYGVTDYGSNLESILSEGGGMQFCGYNSIFNNNNNNHEEDQEKHYFGISNCGLPPLPGEELGWSETNVGLPEDVLNPRIEPEVHVSGECSAKLFGVPASSESMFRH